LDKIIYIYGTNKTFNSLYEILFGACPIAIICISFNSLYEILPIFCARLGSANQFFQFSLWDSLRTYVQNFFLKKIFQFSLWDSSTTAQWPGYGWNLSILFMRFHKH